MNYGDEIVSPDESWLAAGYFIYQKPSLPLESLEGEL